MYMIPKIRFPDFTDEWHLKHLGDVVKFKNGKPFENSVDETGIYNLITIDSVDINGKLKNRFKKSKVTDNSLAKGDIVTVLSDIAYGKLLGLTSLIPQDGLFVLNQRMGRLRPTKHDSPDFLSYYINTKQLFYRKRGQGTSQRHIYERDINQMPICMPQIAEQVRIAKFINIVDSRIDEIEKKLDLLVRYKKGVAQKIFMRTVRFKDSNDDLYPKWQKIRLKDVFDYEQPTRYIVQSTDYSKAYTTPVLTAGKSFLLGHTNETNNIYDQVPVIIFDDFTTSSQLVNFSFKVKSSAMKILKVKQGININVAYEILKRINFVADDHKRYWISEFQHFNVQLPTAAEQEKIANLLTMLDGKIKMEKELLISAKAWRKGLLQRLFV